VNCKPVLIEGDQSVVEKLCTSTLHLSKSHKSTALTLQVTEESSKRLKLISTSGAIRATIQVALVCQAIEMLVQTWKFGEISMAEIAFVSITVPCAAVSLICNVVHIPMPSNLLSCDCVASISFLDEFVDVGTVNLWSLGTGTSF
jgi:hypothetical protein